MAATWGRDMRSGTMSRADFAMSSNLKGWPYAEAQSRSKACIKSFVPRPAAGGADRRHHESKSALRFSASRRETAPVGACMARRTAWCTFASSFGEPASQKEKVVQSMLAHLSARECIVQRCLRRGLPGAGRSQLKGNLDGNGLSSPPLASGASCSVAAEAACKAPAKRRSAERPAPEASSTMNLCIPAAPPRRSGGPSSLFLLLLGFRAEATRGTPGRASLARGRRPPSGRALLPRSGRVLTCPCPRLSGAAWDPPPRRAPSRGSCFSSRSPPGTSCTAPAPPTPRARRRTCPS